MHTNNAHMKFIESTFSDQHRVDREAGVIRNVKILGAVSRNGRRYAESAMRNSSGLYEGKKVYIDHPSRDKRGQERSIRDHVGVFRNVRFDRAKKAVFGDLHYMKESQDGRELAERAERFHEAFGMSHVADGNVRHDENEEFVESIDVVESVDVVTDPATNTSLFESTESKSMKKSIQSILESNQKTSAYRELLYEMAAADLVPGNSEVAIADGASPEDQIKAGLMAAISGKIEGASPEELKKVLKVFGLSDSLTGTVKGEENSSPTEGKAPEPAKKMKESTEAEKKSQLLEAENRLLKADCKVTEELVEAVAASSNPEKLLEQFKSQQSSVSRPEYSPSRFTESYNDSESEYDRACGKVSGSRFS